MADMGIVLKWLYKHVAPPVLGNLEVVTEVCFVQTSIARMILCS